MKSRLVAELAVLMLIIVGCAISPPETTYTPGFASENTMSLQKATVMLSALSQECASLLANCNLFPPNIEMSTTAKSITRIEVVDTKLVLVHDHDVVHSFPLEKLQVHGGTLFGSDALLLDGWTFTPDGPEVDVPGYIDQLADAVMVLKLETPNPEKEAAFQRVAESYRDAKVKPVPSESVRRYVVMAQEAVNRKDFTGAIGDYRAGLKIAPWWPQGHFNVALVMGALHDYRGAIEQMKEYLALVPEAPNAREARDQIYKWEAEKHVLPSQ